MNRQKLYLGIDIGTQGVRAAVVDHHGNLIGQTGRPFELTPESRMEQSPEDWWNKCLQCLKELTETFDGVMHPPDMVSATVTSTSGTVIPLNRDHQPIHQALMYSDPRSSEQTQRIRRVAQDHLKHGYTAFGSSSGLAKMVWYAENFPAETRKIAHWVHAADYITGKMCGVWGITDYTNAFKSGYEVSDLEWPAYLCDELGIHPSWLPKVLPSGSPIGKIDPKVARDTGLPTQAVVTTGCTDGCASQIASGAIDVGDWNTTIGTTMVIKGVTRRRLLDPAGRLYSHRHPEGYWMPGGASNTGADWVSAEYAHDLDDLTLKSESIAPSGRLSYPLRQHGERFPFICAEARGFQVDGLSRPEQFVSNMEGVAFLERMAFEMIEQEFGEKVNRVYTAGGGSQSDIWLRIRSSVLGKPILRMKYVSGAVGAAILGASRTGYHNLTEAAANMIQLDKKTEPVPAWQQEYDHHYKRFVDLLRTKGYINGY